MQRKLMKSHMSEENKVKNSFKEIEDIVSESKEMQNLSINSLKNYRKAFTALYEFFGDDVDGYAITERDARDFVKYLQNEKVHYRDKIHLTGQRRGLKASTINSYIKLCKSIYSELEYLGYIDNNPFKAIRCMSRQNERIKTIPPSDIKKLLESLNKEYFTDFRTYVLIHVLMDTFGRISEILNIRKEDIDFEKRSIYLTDTKNGENRYVTISKKTAKLLTEFIDETREFGCEYVFVGVDGDQFKPEAFRANLKYCCKTFNINTNITPHMFRHTSAMLFLENGGNVRVLQKILGHKKLSTTEIYAHVTDDLIALQQENYSPLNQVMKGDKKYQKARSRRLK